MNLSNFQKVQAFNRAFDMVNAEEPAEYQRATSDMLGRVSMSYYSRVRCNVPPAVVTLRVDLIKEEVGELFQAMDEKNHKEIRDACADILYVTYGMGDVLGLPMDHLYMKHLESEFLRANPTQDDLTFLQHLLTAPVKIRTNFDASKAIGPLLSVGDNKPAWWQYLMSHVHELTTLSEQASLDMESIALQLCQILKIVYLYAEQVGIDADADFAIVHESNMSKLCGDEAEAQATVHDYEAKYAAGQSPYDAPYYYFLPRLGKYIVKNKSTGKALKSINYKAVQF
jgi:predicted HAD superfamily Cof-like phosphohydrolase